MIAKQQSDADAASGRNALTIFQEWLRDCYDFLTLPFSVATLS